MDEERERWFAEKQAAYEKWAVEVDPADLKPAPLEAMGAVAAWINQQPDVFNECLAQTIADARTRGLTWAQIGNILKVSEEDARNKYESWVPAQTPA